MKTFEERKIEVMRRSGERIAKRRRLMRSGVTLAALALCAVSGALLWTPAPPVAPPVGSEEVYLYSANDANGALLPSDGDGATGTLYGGTSDGTRGDSRTVVIERTDGTAVRRWIGTDALERLLLLCNAPSGTDDKPAAETAPDEPQSVVSTAAKTWRFTVRFNAQSTREWTLTGNTLTDDSGTPHRLSDDTLSALKEAFALP